MKREKAGHSLLFQTQGPLCVLWGSRSVGSSKLPQKALWGLPFMEASCPDKEDKRFPAGLLFPSCPSELIFSPNILLLKQKLPSGSSCPSKQSPYPASRPCLPCPGPPPLLRSPPFTPATPLASLQISSYTGHPLSPEPRHLLFPCLRCSSPRIPRGSHLRLDDCISKSQHPYHPLAPLPPLFIFL